MAYQKLQAYRAADVTPSDTVDIPSISTDPGASKNNGCVLFVGGAGNWQHFEEGLKTGVAGVCTQNIFHYTETSILSAKSYLLKKKIDIRK